MKEANYSKPVLLIALGGNALIKKGQEGTIEQQFENLRRPMEQIVSLAEEYNIIITHGNGPQVGNLLLQQECCHTVPTLPLEILVAQTQGQIGYMIESVLDESLMAKGIDSTPLCSLITYVVVDKNDPAFQNPTKPIGPVFTESEAVGLPYPTIKTPKGHRRVVASPEPITVIEKREIKKLIDIGFIVICCGGGGIPVVRKGRAFNGVDAVIDKDLAGECLAGEVGVDVMVMATDVEGVMLHFGTDKQKLLRQVSVSEAEKYAKEGHFSTGAMKPKVEAAIRFVRRGGKKVFIASVDSIARAVKGQTGTAFYL